MQLGRVPENTLVLDDDTVSRHHAEVCRSERNVTVRDLGSTNGTFVNGARLPKAGQRDLKHRDVLKIGDSRFVYLDHKELVPRAPRPDLGEHHERKTMTVRVGTIEDLVARSDKSVGDALVAFGNDINRIRNSGEMLNRTVEAVFDSIPVERVAIQLLGGSELYRELQSDSREPFMIESDIRRQSLDDGLPVQSNDVDSVLCAPIATETSTLGLIYAQHLDPVVLHGGHLERLCSIAGFVAPALESLLEREWLRNQVRLQEEIEIHQTAMVGDSPAMKQVYLTIQKVAPTEAAVLITGENGTGKELAAAAIHRDSPRADKPFIAVNCGAIPEELKQSELFGHEKGSFTGATAQRKGKLEVANGGTVFLDEVGELPLKVQVILLRFLQQHEIQRVGGNVTIHSNVRVIAATNRNLEEMVRQGTFREDLYDRLRVVPLRLPSLAERPDDIPLLSAHFIKIHAGKMGKSIVGVTRDAHELLMSHEWKGNVRQLEHAIIGGIVFAEGDYIRAQDLRRVLEEPPPIRRLPDDSLDSFLERAERWLIETTRDECSGNMTAAAQRLNVHVGTLYRRLEKLGIRSAPQ